MLDVFVASKSRVVDICDRVVRIGGADALQLTLLHAVDRDFLKNGMG